MCELVCAHCANNSVTLDQWEGIAMAHIEAEGVTLLGPILRIEDCIIDEKL